MPGMGPAVGRPASAGVSRSVSHAPLPQLGIPEDRRTAKERGTGTGDAANRAAHLLTRKKAVSSQPLSRSISYPGTPPVCPSSYRGDDCGHPEGLLEDQGPPVSRGGVDDVSVDATGFL